MKINNKMFLLSLVFILLVGSIIPIFINSIKFYTFKPVRNFSDGLIFKV